MFNVLLISLGNAQVTLSPSSEVCSGWRNDRVLATGTLECQTNNAEGKLSLSCVLDKGDV